MKSPSEMPHAGASAHWEHMWAGGLAKGQAFDVGKPSQALVGALARMERPVAGSSALVAGAGRGYDAIALAAHGFDRVVSLDLSATACAAAQALLKEETDDPAAAARVEVVCGDFFEHKGAYECIWDCTFLCALDPSVRERWSRQQRALLAPKGQLITCVFPIIDKVGGPPYAMSVDLVTDLLVPAGFTMVECNEDLPDEQQHRPGGAGSFGSKTTAIAVWRAVTFGGFGMGLGRGA